MRLINFDELREGVESFSYEAASRIGRNVRFNELLAWGAMAQIGDNVCIKAKAIGDNVCIGNNVTIEENVVIGHRVKIGNNVHIHRDVVIGDDTELPDGIIVEQRPRSIRDTSTL